MGIGRRPTLHQIPRRNGVNRSSHLSRNLCFRGFLTPWCWLLIVTIMFFMFNFLSMQVLEVDKNNAVLDIKDISFPKKENTPLVDVPVDGKGETIGYAISLTGCGDESLTDGGAVLKHSIHLSSSANKSSKSKYGYKMYAIVHPDAVKCSTQLEQIGYEILVRDVPVPVADIQGEYLRTKVVNNGCCGEKEFIKLWAYTLTQHRAVVHLDLDTVVLQPLDDLFDAMLMETSASLEVRRNIPVMFEKDMPDVVDAFFTRDYNMNQPRTKKPVLVQGGFLVLRPSMDSFETYKNIIREGDFRQGSGWGGKGYVTYGAMTFQGIVPYFYDVMRPNTSTEVSRCVYNAQADNPRTGKTIDNKVQGDCRDGQSDCRDCREADVSTVKLAHFTLCQKPWNCLPHNDHDLRHKLCRKLHHEWFRIRKNLENQWYSDSKRESMKEQRNGKFQPEQFFGYCKSSGAKGYLPIKVPN